MKEVCSKMGIIEATCYNWKKKYGGLGIVVVADALFDGKKIRCLTTVDNYSRKCMAIHVGQSIKGYQVVEVLEELRMFKGAKENSSG